MCLGQALKRARGTLLKDSKGRLELRGKVPAFREAVNLVAWSLASLHKNILQVTLSGSNPKGRLRFLRVKCRERDNTTFSKDTHSSSPPWRGRDGRWRFSGIVVYFHIRSCQFSFVHPGKKPRRDDVTTVLPPHSGDVTFLWDLEEKGATLRALVEPGAELGDTGGEYQERSANESLVRWVFRRLQELGLFRTKIKKKISVKYLEFAQF